MWQRFTAPFIEPYVRYQYVDVLHAIRLGVAIILAFLANKLTNLPHGEWTTITVFIILGLLQYQGAIYTKAKERVLGTLFGIVTALGVLVYSQCRRVVMGRLCTHWLAQWHHWLFGNQATWVHRVTDGYHYADDCLRFGP